MIKNDSYFNDHTRFRLELKDKLIKNQERRIDIFDTIDSTNSYIKSNPDYANRSVALAITQSGGKGRKGRSFASEKGGIYMSIGIKDNIPDIAFRLCVLSAVCVCETLRELFLVDAKIKWINDIQIDGKKICGILCESVFSINQTPDISVAGMGINIRRIDFSQHLCSYATTLEQHCDITKNSFSDIISDILNRFDCLLDKYLAGGDFSYILNKYREFSAVIEKKIKFIVNNKEITGTAHSIEDDGKLFVTDFQGKTYMLDNADVSIIIL